MSSNIKQFIFQEFIPEILTNGEYSLIYFDGFFSHAVRKFNTSGDFRIQGVYGGQFENIDLEKMETGDMIRKFADDVLCKIPFKHILYARYSYFVYWLLVALLSSNSCCLVSLS